MSAEHGKLGEGKDLGDPLVLAVIFRVSRLSPECFGSRSPERETGSPGSKEGLSDVVQASLGSAGLSSA